MENIINGIISDEQFFELDNLGLFNETKLRDLKIRTLYRELRKSHNSGKSIELINEELPFLQFGTIQKIVLRKNL